MRFDRLIHEQSFLPCMLSRAGSAPLHVLEAQRRYQAESEARPDDWMRGGYQRYCDGASPATTGCPVAGALASQAAAPSRLGREQKLMI